MSVHAKRDITTKPKPPQVSSEHVTKSPREALALATQEKKLAAVKLKSNADTRVQTRSAKQKQNQNLKIDKSLVPKGDQRAHGAQEQPDGLHSESPKSPRETHFNGNSRSYSESDSEPYSGREAERARSRSSSLNDYESHYQIEALQHKVRASEQALQLEKQAALMQDQAVFMQQQTALIAQYRAERESQFQCNATENHEGKYTSGNLKVESTPEFRPSRRDWKPTPATPREVSPTRSVLSMLSDRQHTQTERTTAGLKHIKIEIVALQLNQNELEWRKAVTAATAALKKPHLLESSHRAYTHAQLGQLFSDLRLEMPARFQTPMKIKTPAKQSSATLDTMPSWWTQKATEKGDTFAQLASTYTDRIIEQDLKFVVVWVTVGENNLPDIENEYDSECRTILFTHMKKSLKAYAHMTKDVVHGDCRALFNAVILQNNPEPRQLLVRCFQQLVKHEKTAAEPYQPWVTTLQNIFNALDTVDFPLAPHVRLGFMMALLAADKRYTPILEKAQEREWDIEKCQIHFDRHATKLNDLIKPIRMPAHSANAVEPGKEKKPYTPKGGKGNRGEKGEKSKTPYHPGDTEEANLANLQLRLDEARNKRDSRVPTDPTKNTRRHSKGEMPPCINYSEGRPCHMTPCKYSHILGPDNATKQPPAAATKPATAATAEPAHKAEPANKLPHGTCFQWAQGKTCNSGDTCRFKHSINMVELSWAPGSTVTIDKLLTNGLLNITTTILSTKMVKQPNGTLQRFYSVTLPTAHLDKLHEQFAYMAGLGIHEKYLTLTPAPVAVPTKIKPTNTAGPTGPPSVTEVMGTTAQAATLDGPPPVTGTVGSTPNASAFATQQCNSFTGGDLNPCIDNACTFNIINTNKYFIPGTVRQSTLMANFNSQGAAAACSTSGLVQLRQQDGSIFMDRWHYLPSAPRSLLSLGRMNAMGYTMLIRLHDTVIMTKEGETAFTCLPERDVSDILPTKEELDSDDFVPPLVKLDENSFIFPDHVRIPACNLVAPPPPDRIVPAFHEVHNANHLDKSTPSTRLGRVQMQNLCDWHKRLAHADIRKVGFVLGIRLRDSLTNEMICAHCACAKIKSDSKGVPRPHPTRILQTVYIDAVGPFTPSYQDGFRYMHTVHEKFSEHTFTEFSVDRAEGGPFTLEWIDSANSRHHPHKVTDLISDGAPEYATSQAFNEGVRARGVTHTVNAPYAHHQSANVERPQRTIQDLARAERLGGGLPPSFWPFANAHASQVKSILPTSRKMNEAATNKDDHPLTPHEIWTGTRASSYADLHRSTHSFGAQCVVYHPTESRDSKKNSDHGEIAIYLCKALPATGHKCLLLASGKVRIFRTVEVHETVFPFLLELQKSVPYALQFAPATQAHLEANELEESPAPN